MSTPDVTSAPDPTGGPQGSEPFRILRTRATVQLLPGGDTQDAIEVWYASVPDGVEWVNFIPDNQFTTQNVILNGRLYGNAIAQERPHQGVIDMYVKQDVNAAGNLLESMVFVLASDDGRVTEEFAVSPLFHILGVAGTLAAVDREIAKLNTMAGY